MLHGRDWLALLPAGLLTLCAVLRLPTDQVGAALLAMGATGALLGVAVSSVRTRRRAAALVTAAARLAADGPEAIGDPARFGPLGPLATELAGLGQALQVAHEAATTDRLTRVSNRPTLLAHLFQEVERAARHERPLSVAFVDLDQFKAINDTHGHEVGDAVLRGVADIFRSSIRAADIVGRYGGEEFLIVLPETTIEEAATVAEKLRLAVLKFRASADGGTNVSVSISIGVSGGQGRHLHVDQLIRDADAAMYSAKSLGRNQTYVFEELDDDNARIPRAPISSEGRARATQVGDLARQAAEATLAAVLAPLPHYAGRPSSLIAAIAVRIATQLDLPEQEVERIRVAALLHDMGKVAVPEQILEKPAPLSAEEWQTVVQHPRVGQVIVDQVAAVKDAGVIILHHHEHFSGHGYPHGLRGADIPLGARIVAIADAYDAMVHDRPYRAAIGHTVAIDELRRHAGIQFDPELVDVFCALFAADPPAPDPTLMMRDPTTFMGHMAGARWAASA